MKQKATREFPFQIVHTLPVGVTPKQVKRALRKGSAIRHNFEKIKDTFNNGRQTYEKLLSSEHITYLDFMFNTRKKYEPLILGQTFNIDYRQVHEYTQNILMFVAEHADKIK
jgi:hypothetical protein